MKDKLLEDDHKILKVQYLSNHLWDHPQILNSKFQYEVLGP